MPVNACSSVPASFDPEDYDPTDNDPSSGTRSAAPPTSSPLSDETLACHGTAGESQPADAASSAAGKGDTSRARSEIVALYHSAASDSTTGDLTVGVAGLKGHDPRSGIDTEVFFAGAETGPSFNGAQLGMGRIGISGQPGWDNGFVESASASLEVFTAHAGIGVHNPDGSTGFGVSVGASAVGTEVSATLADGLVSGSFGVSAGVTLEASVGLRDGNHDGRPELCGRVGVGFVTGDVCLEWPF